MDKNISSSFLFCFVPITLEESSISIDSCLNLGQFVTYKLYLACYIPKFGELRTSPNL